MGVRLDGVREYPSATKCRRNASTGGMGDASESMTVNERCPSWAPRRAWTDTSIDGVPSTWTQSRCHPRAHHGATPYVAFVKDARARTLDKLRQRQDH